MLYGPPAAGKDTVTKSLVDLDARYLPFKRMKIGQGRTQGYRMSSMQQLIRLRESREVVWENERYGSTYVVDRPFLVEEVSRGIPIIHLGQSEAINSVRASIPGTMWIVIYLWCARNVAEQRIIARATGDTAARMQAWDATDPIAADLTIDTGATSPEASARLIDAAVTGR